MFDNIEDTLLVSFCGVHDKDNPVLVVGRKRPNQTVDIINAFQGEEAEELYKKLVTKVKRRNKMGSSDCFYCEFDQGPLKGRHEKCQTCEKGSNFECKIRMTPNMMCRWEDKQRFEREFLSNVEPFDEETARMVLDDICEFVSFRPNGEQLIISLDKFNLIRKKYLDGKKTDNSNPKEYDDDDPFRGLR